MTKQQSSSAHTTGDWYPVHDSSTGKWRIHAKHRRSAIEFDHEIAEICFKGQEAQANARLIATAPELLRLAKTFLLTCEDRIELLKEEDWRPDDEREDMTGHYTALSESCKSVLAKAEGNSPKDLCYANDGYCKVCNKQTNEWTGWPCKNCDTWICDDCRKPLAGIEDAGCAFCG